MKKITFLAVSLIGLGMVVVSASYKMRVGQDCGGGETYSVSYRLRGSIGGTVVGKAQSVSYVSYAGTLRYTRKAESVVVVENVSKVWLTTGEECIISWYSKLDGNFYIEVGGDGTPGSGVLVESGVCSAGVGLQSRIYELDLSDNKKNTVYIIVDDGVDVYYAVVVLFDDQLSPDAVFERVTVRGKVDDDSVSEVYVDGVAVPVDADGRFEAIVVTPSDEIVVEATNGKGQTVKKVIRLR